MALDLSAYITTESSSELSAEDAVELYRQREHAGNSIRELKNGFDLHHFPCQKLNANRAYGLIAAFAYNFMRFVGIAMSPTKPMFSKKIRFKLAICHRKNSLFYRTQNGARNGDIIQSIIKTCNSANVNSFVRFRRSAQVYANPEMWLPWDYRSSF